MYIISRLLIKKLRSLLSIGSLVILLELILLFFFLYWHYRIGIVRYFDQDEFAHLHWGYNYFSGLKPYSGYLYFFPPGFLLFLYPLFSIIPQTVFIFTAARFYAFLVFLFFASGLFLLTYTIRNWKTALLSVVILSFLPVPFDKLIEIRPDNLATAFCLFGIFFLARGILKEAKSFMFLSGLSYGMGLFILTKALFFLPAVGCIFILWILYPHKLLREPKLLKRLLIAFFAGITIPLLITLVIFFQSQDFTNAVYLTTKFAGTSSKILGEKFRIIPNLWFYAVSSYYGEEYPNLYLYLNLGVYLGAIFFGIIRFVSSLSKKSWPVSMVEILISVSFISNWIAYLYIFPLKHSQYMIAFCPLIAFYFADLVAAIFSKLSARKIVFSLSNIVFIILLILMAGETQRINQMKVTWTNKQTIDYAGKIYETIPKGSYIFDLFGETIFYRDPYFVCCLPYGQYIQAFGSKLPSLQKALTDTGTKYIYVRDKDRLTVLPAREENFIRSNYLASSDAPIVFMPGKIMQINVNQETDLEIIIEGSYDLYLNGIKLDKDRTVNNLSIDGNINFSTPYFFSKDLHKIKAQEKGELKVVYRE